MSLMQMNGKFLKSPSSTLEGLQPLLALDLYLAQRRTPPSSTLEGLQSARERLAEEERIRPSSTLEGLQPAGPTVEEGVIR